jgi:membrane associated rhomboid family serine protease
MRNKQDVDCGKRVWRACLGFARRRWDALFLVVILAAINGPLFTGGNTDFWALYPQAVAHGQWWRVVTNDFAHNNLVHLSVVGLLFWIVYLGLVERRPLIRLAYVFLSAAGSNLAAMLFASTAATTGMCGLSGVLHGLLGIWGLERLTSPRYSPAWRAVGGAVLSLTAGKLLFEQMSGWSLYALLHLDGMGAPAVSCHLGGLLAGVLAFACFRFAASRGGSRRLLPGTTAQAENGLRGGRPLQDASNPAHTRKMGCIRDSGADSPEQSLPHL